MFLDGSSDPRDKRGREVLRSGGVMSDDRTPPPRPGPTVVLDGGERPGSRGHDPHEAAAAEQLARGQTIGRFVILALVGRGGMGEVYAAYDPELDRKVAVKVMRPR